MGHSIKLIILTALFSCCFQIAETQQEPGTQREEIVVLEDVYSDTKREEIQRYFGYDDLLTNYLTLPYDVSTNVNEKGRFVDIGFYLIGLLPLILLYAFRNNKICFYSLIALLIVYLFFCFSHSVMFDEKFVEHKSLDSNWDSFAEIPDKRFDVALLTKVFKGSRVVTSPLNYMIYKISGQKDGVSYPILIIAFSLIVFLLSINRTLSSKTKILSIILFSYSFIWLLLSGGIIWYAYLIIPIGLLIIGHAYSRVSDKNLHMFKWLKILIVITLTSWGVLIFVLRISNITISNQLSEEHLGKSILEANLLYYSTGILNADQTLEHSFRNLSRALTKINQGEELIYMIGTSFSFDIINSKNRIYSDNLLNSFLRLLKKYPDKNAVIRALKSSNFKYIVVDLYTDTLDQTPEKSLTQKYKLLLNTLYQNPNVSLIATDRVVEFTDVNGKKQKIGNVFGNIVFRGSYAVYEIL